MRLALGLLLVVTIAITVTAQTRPRGRELGIPFPGTTGPLNAITDVPGIAVGHVTLIEGEGKLVPSKGPVRTGVTAILPRPRGNWDPVFAATFNQNQGGYTIGVLVQCNYGGDLRILGVPIRSEITDLGICTVLQSPQSRPWTAGIPPCSSSGGAAPDNGSAFEHEGRGSIIVIVAVAASTGTNRASRQFGTWTAGELRRQFVRRFVSCVFDGECRCCKSRRDAVTRDASQ